MSIYNLESTEYRASTLNVEVTVCSVKQDSSHKSIISSRFFISSSCSSHSRVVIAIVVIAIEDAGLALLDTKGPEGAPEQREHDEDGARDGDID